MHDWREMLEQRFRGETRDPATQSELLEELSQHLELRASELRAQGISEESIRSHLEQEIAELDAESLIAARRNPTRSYGAVPTSRGGWFDGLARDLVVGWRSLRRTLGLTAVVILSLALVLGANSTIFSLTNAMYLRRLDLPSPGQLVRVDVVRDGRITSLPYAQFESLRSSAGQLTFAAYRFEGVEVTTPPGDTQRLWLDLVTGSYFDLIGIRPLLGRTLDAQDEASHANVVVVSEDYWCAHLDAREDVLGQTLRLSEKPFTIVGVLPSRYRGLHFAHQFQMAAPFTASPTGFSDLGILATTIVARLDPARDPRAQRSAFAAAIRACCADRAPPGRNTALTSPLQFVAVDDPPYHEDLQQATSARGLTVELTDASRGLAWGRDFRARYKAALIGVVGGVLLLLLIACANVATLLLVRGESRAREFAIRRSLGASVARVRRQLFVEALELCLPGAVLGIALAWIATTLLSHALPASARPLRDVIAWRVDVRFILATLAMTTFCAVVTSLWPTRRLGRDELLGALAGARKQVVSGLASHRALAVGQIALSMILITAAWLFVATIRNLTESDGGYGSRDVLLAQISVRRLGEPVIETTPTLDRLRNDLLHISTVRAVAYAVNAPVMQDGLMQAQVAPLGGITPEPIATRMNLVSPGFFTAIGSWITRGRDFTTGDDGSAGPVAVVSESFQHRYYGDRSALGAILLFPDRWKSNRVRVVGVARDVRYDRMRGSAVDLRDPETEMIYVPFAQSPAPRMATMIIAPATDAASVVTPIRRVIEQHHLEPQRITTVGALLDDAASRERFSAALATAFGVLAVLLSVTGVLGVLSFQVARRTKEIGVRMALGAQRQDVIALVLEQTLTMVASALVLGIPAAIGACWFVRSQLFGVPPWDPRGIVTAVAAIGLAGIAASLVPSNRAARVDPLVALREE
jgi:predicted permease